MPTIIIIVGAQGSGKTTLAKALAAASNTRAIIQDGPLPEAEPTGSALIIYTIQDSGQRWPKWAVGEHVHFFVIGAFRANYPPSTPLPAGNH